jgi:glycosyltransferase involved in cell wall biosynthesis
MNSVPERPKPRIIVCNLGTRGAGPKLTFQIAEHLDRLKISQKVIVSSKNDQIHNFASNLYHNTILVDIENKLHLFSIHKYLKFKRIIGSLNLTDRDHLIFIMPHPWDRYIKSKASIYRVIHDSQRHPGDSWWPTTVSLKGRIKSGDHLICLSEHVAESIKILGYYSNRVHHPDFVFEKMKHSEKILNQVVFIGRQRKYKGAALLAEAWPLVLRRVPSAKLLICGQGRIPRKLARESHTEIHNRWLSENEISEFLDASTVAVFPYIEASQSGLIGPAWNSGCRIVVTPVGGLIEQANRVHGFIAEAITPIALADQIVKALTSPSNYKSQSKSEAHGPDLLTFISKLATS